MELVRARVGRERDASYLDAGLLLAGAALLAAVPWVAARLAERATGWVDTDRDGMLDPMVNGAYDWSDINAGHWFMYAALLAAVIVGGVVAIVMVHRSRARRRPPPPGHNLVTDFPQQAVTGEVSTT